MEGDEEVGSRLFIVVLLQDKRQRTQTEMQEILPKYKKKIYLFVYLFTVTVTKYWNTLPREIVEPASLEVFKTQLDMLLGNLL